MAINGIGRPSDYSEDKASQICARMATGETLTSVCRDPVMPSRETVYNWMDGHPDFLNAYAQARQRMGDAHFDGLIDESILPGDATPAQVQSARLRVDTMKWTASRLRPSAYGDKLHVEARVTVGHEAALDALTGPIVDITPDSTELTSDVTHVVTHDDDSMATINDINELDDDGP